MDDDLYAIFAHDDEPADNGSDTLVSLLRELVAITAAIGDELSQTVVDDQLTAMLPDVGGVYTVLHDLEAKVRNHS
jgi:hypothetical protein